MLSVRNFAPEFDTAMLLGLYRQGCFSELESILRSLVIRYSRSEFLWGLLGTAQEAQGKDGMEALLRATAIAPTDFDANTSLGQALRNRGQLEESAAAFAKALAAQPANPWAQLDCGEALRLQGQYAKAEPVLRALVEAHPQFVEALVSLSDVLSELKRYAEAELRCRKAVMIAPDFSPAHFCLGDILKKVNRLPEACSAYAEAIRADSSYVAAYDSMGCVLQEIGEISEAERYHREALRLDPAFSNALSNLGRLFSEASRFAEAEEMYRELVRLQPENVSALERLGNVLYELGRSDEADVCFQAALLNDEDNLRLRFASAMLTLPVVARDVDEAISVPERFNLALSELAAWQESTAKRCFSGPELAELPLPFSLAYREGNHVAVLSRFADAYSRCVSDEISLVREQRKRLRLLVVSQHVRSHSVWNIVLRGLLIHLDRSKFELVIYHLGNLEDDETALAKKMADIWRDRNSVSDAVEWLSAARFDRPDVIFYPELGMASLSYMLAAHRLAPVQIAGWGHPITSGLATIDMFFTGELIEPPDAQAHYRERLVLLPGTGCCTQSLPVTMGPVDDLYAVVANHVGPRFIIAQRAIKFDPSDDFVFAEIASRVTDSIFVLLRDPVAGWATDVVVDRLRGAFLESGASPDRQIVVLPWLSSEQFLGVLDVCDVYLDCPSFSGYTTAWQALHHGIPIVTLEGQFMRQRLAAGLLRKVELPETIAASTDDYVRIALSLAGECRKPERRSAVRQRFSAAAHKADNDLAVVRAFEKRVLDEVDAQASNASLRK